MCTVPPFLKQHFVQKTRFHKELSTKLQKTNPHDWKGMRNEKSEVHKSIAIALVDTAWKAACSLQAQAISYFRSKPKMTAVSDVNSPLVSKCMDFCQALASQGQTFHFSLNMGPTFSFSLDTRGKAVNGPVKKKESPSTQRRNARRREEFLTKKRQTPSTVNSTVEHATASSFPCDHCDYTNVSEKGLRQHKRMKHGKPQLDTQLQSSSPSTPEMLRKPTSYSAQCAVC